MNGCIIPIDSGHEIFISTYLTLSKPSNSGLSRIFRYKTKAIFSHIEAPSLMETRAGFHICDTVTSTIFTARWWYLSYGIIIPFLYEFLVENSTFFEATNDTGPSNSMQFHWITYVYIYICIIIFKHIHPVCFFGSTSFYRHGKKTWNVHNTCSVKVLRPPSRFQTLNLSHWKSPGRDIPDLSDGPIANSTWDMVALVAQMELKMAKMWTDDHVY